MLNPSSSQTEIQAFLDKIEKEQSFSAALDALYKWECQVGYLTEAKLHGNLRYTYFDSELNITFKTQINIARSGYTPKPLSADLHCPICFENIGIPGKEDLRVFEFILSGKPFFAQLTPFPLYPKHFVLVSREKTPMIINHHSIEDMLNFLRRAPTYSVFSNSDVEGAGASVRIHHHYQTIEHLKLPITEAIFLPEFFKKVSEETSFGLLNFPIATCLIKSTLPEDLLCYGKKILENWRNPSSENTCNLALHQTKEKGQTTYFLYLIFRNPSHRTPGSLIPVKSEGVGVIEVCGEGIYPVPTDPLLAEKIEHEGLGIIKSIIEGNNPVKRDHFGELFQQLLR